MKLLKLPAILLSLALLSGFTACSSNDDDDDNGYGNNGGTVAQEKNLEGKWMLESFSGWEIEDGEKVPFDDKASDYTWDEYYVFEKDGTGYHYFTDEEGQWDFTWSISGKVIRFTPVEYPQYYELMTIESLTSSTLILIDDQEEDYYERNVFKKVK